MQAFLAEYTKWPLFQTSSGSADLTEFDDAREVVMRLSAEYRSFEEAEAPQVQLPKQDTCALGSEVPTLVIHTSCKF